MVDYHAGYSSGKRESSVFGQASLLKASNAFCSAPGSGVFDEKSNPNAFETSTSKVSSVFLGQKQERQNTPAQEAEEELDDGWDFYWFDDYEYQDRLPEERG